MAAGRISGFITEDGRRRYAAAYARGMASLPEPAEVRDVPTPYGRVRVHRFGDAGPPVVLLPGRGGTVVMFAPNVPELARHCRVYAVDLLGEAGHSVQTAPIRDGADQAAWLDAVLAALGIRGAHLVGVSIGGWAAANLAVRAPDRLASVTLLEPASTLAPISAGMIMRVLATYLPVVGDRARRSFLTWIGGGDPVPEDDPAGQVIDAGMRYFRLALPAPPRFGDAQLRSIGVPVLVLLGGRSVVHDARRALRRARALIPRVTAELWPAATHALSGQFPAEVNARILRFAGAGEAGRRSAGPGDAAAGDQFDGGEDRDGLHRE